MQTAFQAEKPYNRPSGDGNAPLLPPAAASPPEGEILAALCFEVLISPKAEQRANFPLRGKSRVAGIGVHFQRAAGAVLRFSLPMAALPPQGGI